MRLVRVPSLDDPDHHQALSGYANLKDRDLRPRGGLFIAEGALVVRELIRSRFPVESVLIAQPRLDSMRDALDALPIDTPVYVAPQAVLDAIVGFHVHRGVLALGRRLPPTPPGELLAGAPAAVILENLTNHDNVGGIFRTVAALAPPNTPVLLSPGCCDPLYRKALRVSIGHVLHVPFTTLTPWPDALASIRHAGFHTLALTPRDSPDCPARTLGEEIRSGPPRRWALVLGTEGSGLSDAALRACAQRLRIPMAPSVDSLNVVVAAGIALYALASGLR